MDKEKPDYKKLINDLVNGTAEIKQPDMNPVSEDIVMDPADMEPKTFQEYVKHRVESGETVVAIIPMDFNEKEQGYALNTDRAITLPVKGEGLTAELIPFVDGQAIPPDHPFFCGAFYEKEVVTKWKAFKVALSKAIEKKMGK